MSAIHHIRGEASAALDARIRELHAGGLGDTAIAQRLGIAGKETVRARRIKLGLDAKSRRRVRPPLDEGTRGEAGVEIVNAARHALKSVSRRLRGLRIPDEDLLSAAHVSLVEDYADYDPARGTRRAFLLARAIQAMLTYARVQIPLGYRRTTVRGDSVPAVRALSPLDSPRAPDEKRRGEDLDAVQAVLSRREWEIIATYAECGTVAEAMRRAGCSRGDVTRTIYAARRRLGVTK